MYAIARRFAFTATHHVDGDVHAHRFIIELRFETARLSTDGFVFNFHDLDCVEDFVQNTLHQRNLNSVIEVTPTSENIAHWMFDRCIAILDPAITSMLRSVRIEDSPWTMAEFAQD